ncbi:NADP-dependent oxidoreductase [Lentzea sp. NPDC059081]|uniref:NADP-dependent oxidoreductase n=1 Tax=Lentzea sp. NPDC059081 TaxID=3346719 RepID=UPI00368E3D8F
MRAVVAKRYGQAEVLAVEDVPVPLPGPGQIQVRIRAAAINPADLRTLSGVWRDLSPLTFPHVPGSDFAGTVTEVGPGVTRFVQGDEVFGTALPRAAKKMATVLSDPPSLTTGAMAEYAVFEADTPAITRRPDGLSADHAATLPIPGLTSLAVLREGGFEAGQRVLVTGAAGGVGGAVVPLLAASRVHVIATALPEDDDHVRDLGATEVIDYRTTNTITETLRRHPGGVDAMVNLVLPGPALVEASHAIRPGGHLLNVAFPSPDPSAFDRADLTVRTVYSTARAGDLDHLAAQALAGTLPSTVSRRYALDEGARAYGDLMHSHVRGKLLVTADATS